MRKLKPHPAVINKSKETKSSSGSTLCILYKLHALPVSLSLSEFCYKSSHVCKKSFKASRRDLKVAQCDRISAGLFCDSLNHGLSFPCLQVFMRGMLAEVEQAEKLHRTSYVSRPLPSLPPSSVTSVSMHHMSCVISQSGG